MRTGTLMAGMERNPPWASGSVRGGCELVVHGADPFDVAEELIAGAQEPLRCAAPADARRRPREDQVAGEEREHARQVGDEDGNGEDEFAGLRLLHLLAVEQAPDLDVVGVGELVGGDEGWADGGEPGERLGQVVLLGSRRLELQVPFGKVLADGEPGDVAPAVTFRHPVRPPADDGDKLDLEVHRSGWEFDGVKRSGHRGGEFGEYHRARRQLQAGLFGVVLVVEPDGEDLARLRDRGTYAL